MNPAGANRPSTARRRSRSWVIAGLVLAALAVLGVALVPLTRDFRGKWHARRAAAFTDEGWIAWQQGRLREAEIALESAEALAPSAVRPKLLRARLCLQKGDDAKADAIFRDLMGRADAAGRQEIAANYHDALVGTCRWSLLLQLSIQEQRKSPAASAVWLSASLEAARLHPNPVLTPESVAAATSGLPGGAAGLLRARLLLRTGDAAGARAALATMPGSLAPSEALLAARLLVEAGDPDRARTRVLLVQRPLTAQELAIASIALGLTDSREAAQAAARLCSGASDPAQQAGALLQGLAQALPDALPEVAEAFDRGLEPLHAALSPSILDAIWLLNDFAGRTESADRWRERVQTRRGIPALPRGLRPLTPNAFLLLTQYLPLPRVLVYGLVGRLPSVTTPAGS